MRCDMGGFYPVRPTSDGVLHAMFFRHIRLKSLADPHLRHMAVCLQTPGFEPRFWATLMRWGPERYWLPRTEWVVNHYGDPSGSEGTKNAMTVTMADGLDWLRAVLRHDPWFRGEVPVWTRRALRELRADVGDGRKLEALLEEDRQAFMGDRWRPRKGAWTGAWTADVR